MKNKFKIISLILGLFIIIGAGCSGGSKINTEENNKKEIQAQQQKNKNTTGDKTNIVEDKKEKGNFKPKKKSGVPLEAAIEAAKKIDSDNDGTNNFNDLCPEKASQDQSDKDNDSVGDVCDQCPDQKGPPYNDGCPDK